MSATTWMNRTLSDAERTAQAKEIRPGVFVSPWERGVCRHNKAYPVRWRWHAGEDIESAEPEMGNHGCKACDE